MEKELKRYYTYAYSGIRSKSKKRGNFCDIKKQDLINWLIYNGIIEKFRHYINSGYLKDVKPSIDRIDDYKGYSFDNMQLITWKENRLKGVKSEKHKINSSIINKKNFSKTVYQYDKSYNLINTFSSCVEASIVTKIHAVDINRVCLSQRKSSHGFYFSYIELNNDNHKKNNHKLSKKTIQMDKNGKVLKIWDSICLAGNELNINPSSISKSCLGKLNTTGGFKWSYFKELTLSE